ncbi:MAG: NADPH-dependent glutamate synthase [Candidatus Saganbacteria bacterium]|nr:NADPH-dependent glutamate synthase [Candidatus Saganbacteria bacterium]
MPERPAKDRIADFGEVALGLSKEEAIAEAKRCIQCKNPTCMKGCPVMIDIPAFIKFIALGEFEQAIDKIKEKNALPGICGRVCPQEDQCEKMCVLSKKGEGVGIGYLERFAADREVSQESRVTSRESNLRLETKVAVIGSGPAGLTCAGDLAKMCYNVTLFESLSTPGGVLVYGIPEFRLPKKIVGIEVDYVRSLGVEIRTDTLVGQTLTIEDLFKDGYRAIFVGSGAGLPNFMGVPGENLKGVYSANEFLVRVNLMKAYKFPEYLTPVKIGERVCVVGAGNVAMDSARVSLRLGAKEVTIVYRRSRAEMPAREEEIIRAEEEGIRFILLTAPTEILGDEKGSVKGMECLKMKLGEPDPSGRRRPVPIEGSEYVIACDTVIVAIGQSPNPLIPKATPGLKTEKWGGVVISKEGMTSIPGVYAGGDIVSGAATVISAMGAGKLAAASIKEHIK